MKSQKKAAVKREVHIIARYYIKKTGVSNGVTYTAGSVVLLVENDKGVRYFTTIRPNGVHSCSCPAKKSCYHITHCAGLESALDAAAEQELAAIEEKRAAALVLAKEVEQICVETEREAARETAPARELAPLNGNRPFSLFRQKKAVA